ncbi:MAG: HAMP domain-containing histidine kinase, partial [Nitrospinae bacterium]|nr:HAMP domain-containing histidine kinase [Nitrospinota bacterium]
SLVLRQKGVWQVVAAVGGARPDILHQEIDPAGDSVSARVIRSRAPFYFSHIDQIRPGEPDSQRSEYPTDIFCSFPVVGADGAVIAVLNVSGITGAHPLFAHETGSIDGALAAVAVKLAKLNKNAQARRLASRSARERERLDTALKDLFAARQQETLKERLMFMMVHDLKNPLALILSNLTALAETPLSGEGKELVELSRFGCERLFDMIKSSLDSYRIQSGTMCLTVAPFDLAALLSGMVAEFGVSARYDEIVLAYDGPATLPLTGDEGVIRRIVSNLLDNALRHSPLGGRVTVTLAQEGERAVVHVDDEGEGIAPEDRERILDLFAQAERGGNAGGYGLGLAFCAMACDAHGGRVTVGESPAAGARLTVTLPLSPPQEEE